MHKNASTEEMWDAMKEHGSSIVSTPVDELGMYIGNPVALDAIDRGVKSGLGVVNSWFGTIVG